ncbi:hypothetical protein F5Y16DRAFT_407001 [Xylariaceae sp. FL0255]|nr:hypothetical protein F5Y16DRAFT_407001 [Xylariaceae sp. FL0255]
MDDPFNWDVDRVVRELCSPIPDQLAACLRDQGVDGHTFLTYPDESELCKRLGFITLKRENTLFHVRRDLRRRSKLY